MDEGKKKAAPGNPTVLRRGAQALGFNEGELKLTLAYRTVRLRWEPRLTEHRGRGWREVLTQWRQRFDLQSWRTLVERLPLHAARVLAAMREVPAEVPQDEEALKELGAVLAGARSQYLAFATLCAAVDALGSVLLADEGLAPEPHGAYSLLTSAAEFRAFRNIRKRIWKARNQEAYRQMIAASNARPSALAARRRYMREKRRAPAWADAERTRRRATYAARKPRAA